jgi:phosphoribosylglycinamide formyltransferase-1/phosphoribosylamine--glycine ligase/phosphoribosylglycinamide formyltransferase/phosphoribosylformylglycinamidine cyclo-ligase
MTGRPARIRVGVLISGQGSNMEALVRRSLEPDCPYDVALVISNRPGAAGLAVAAAMGTNVSIIDHADFGMNREDHERAIDKALRFAGCQAIALAGYMRILTPFLVEAWSGRMINIHPSLLPSYPGLETHRRAIEAGDHEAGCSVHLVTTGLDAGPVLGQSRVAILPKDTVASLAARVLAAEHQLYPQCLADFVRSIQD